MIEIKNIVKKLKINSEFVDYYGKYKAKIDNSYLEKIKNKKQGKLVLVTATNPTPYGEGKTTQTIGISMALNKLKKSSICVLREPSLGPVFGVKGGAIGGGMSCIEPQMDINLQFNGDFYSIEVANNLICAIIDNHIFNGNTLNIDTDKICIKRVIDINDRALRNVVISSSGNKNGTYNSSFELTVASEIMAICALSNSKEELKQNLENMIVAYTKSDEPIYLRNLNCTNAILALLNNTLSPNLVQTSENTPCLVHLGPFANIAHGCNSIVATNIALKSCDITVTEAGFGSDLGAEKFFNIKSRKANLHPDVCVIVTTIRALKYNGNEDISIGIKNLEKHIENIKSFNVPAVVCINKFDDDSIDDINYIKNFCKDKCISCEVSTCFKDGSAGAMNIAKTILDTLNKESFDSINYTYSLNDTIVQKIKKLAKTIYGAAGVNFNDTLPKIENITKLGYNNLPICIAKTPFSLSDNKSLLGRPEKFNINVTDIKLNAGAGFIVVYLGDILTMPGLGKKCKYENF